nr:MAG TPA: virion protein [Caudoviricetes sp.]
MEITIKRNNPGNLRPASRKWQGEITRAGGKYCEFATLEWGCRAMLKLLSTYRTKHGLTTVQGIITRWAPPSDGNDTNAYIRYVAERLGVTASAHLSSAHDITLARAMAKMETGQEIPAEVWERATLMI